MISHTDEKDLGLNGILLSFSVGCALFIGGLIYVLKNGTIWSPVNDSTYLALRSAYRVVDFLHLQAVSPVKTSVLRRQIPSGTERLGIEICVLVTVLGLTAAASLLLSLLTYLRHFRVVIERLTLVFLLFAAPFSYLTVSRLTWSWPPSEPYVTQRGSFRESFPLRVFIIEIACLCALLILLYLRRRVMPKRVVAALLSFHVAFWTYVLWYQTRTWLYSRDLVLLLTCALPFVYMLQDRDRLVRVDSLKSPWVVGVAIALVIAFAAVWAPTKTVALSHPQDLTAVKIELAEDRALVLVLNTRLLFRVTDELNIWAANGIRALTAERPER
jgi:hypothetical protein